MEPLKTRLSPPPHKGHISVAKLHKFWYIACTSAELKSRPLARLILGTPLVVFRGKDGSVGALLDLCPHRNVPLSTGEVVGDRIQCGYHGWQFDTAGACRLVPGLCSASEGKGRNVTSYPAREQDGYIWVYMDPEQAPEQDPYKLPLLDEDGYTTVRESLDVESSVHAAIENALDVPHTAFLHKGLFRGSGEPNLIKVVVRRWHDHVEAEFIGEPRPEGLVGRIVSPSGGVVTHFDRFIMPCIAQVEYKLGDENHIIVTSFWTPMEDFKTRMFAAITFKFRVPGWIVQPFLRPIVLRIFNQDAVMLKLQTDAIQRFGGERFVSTEIDVLGPHIWRLMTQTERGNPYPGGDGELPVIKELSLKA